MSPDELRALARDRPLVTRELHPFNAFYGHDVLLKRYAGLPLDRPLKAAIEHGVSLSEAVADIERDLRLPYYLCGAPWRVAAFDRLARRGARAVAIGPISSYALQRAVEPEARTLLLVPAHSTHHFAAEYDIDAFLATTHARRGAFDSTAVCLYWRDVVAGGDAPYRARGIRVVTAGHMYDPDFVPRLLGILGSATAVVTNEPGTHVVYAALLDRPVQIVPQAVTYRLTSRDTRTRLAVPRNRVDELRARFAEPLDELTRRQRDLVQELAGAEHVRAPGELRELLLEAEEEYRRRTPRRVRARLAALATTRRLLGAAGLRGQ